MAEQRLIDAYALKRHYAWWGDTDERRDFDTIVDLQPTVEAVPVVRGEWMDVCGVIKRCSNCKSAAERSAFCPNCGADMRGGENGTD